MAATEFIKLPFGSIVLYNSRLIFIDSLHSGLGAFAVFLNSRKIKIIKFINGIIARQKILPSPEARTL